MKKLPLIFLSISFVLSLSTLKAQYKSNLAASQWVDSVFNTLTPAQRIAQLMIIRAHSNLGPDHVAQVTDLIKKYDVGGLCFFQGGPVRQANLTNFYQSIAQTPLMITIDGEWGLGMRLDSVVNFPRQLMVGAVPDGQMVYKLGHAIGEQCKRMGVQVNFAPDVDINNNPENPVINDRSFGEDKYRVALFGTQFIKGMQDVGVMASAKHFPGHGDVAVDSHFDLPVINKSMAELDTLELYPFKQVIKNGVGSIMIAHLYIPAIDTTANQATSLSYKNVTGLLRNKLGYNGITFTDALEMKGVTKFYPSGAASVQSLIAGNDMLCLPGDVPSSIIQILQAITDGKLQWDDLNARVKKVLLAKYRLGLNHVTPIDTTNLVNDLNAQTGEINAMIAGNAITLLRQKDKALIPIDKNLKIAYVAVGLDSLNTFGKRMVNDLKADPYYFDYKQDLREIPMLVSTIKNKYKAVIIGIHGYSRRPANNFGLPASAIEMVNRLQDAMPAVTFVFGNPYAIRNVDSARNLVAAYEDIESAHTAAADLLDGKTVAEGKLTVTVSDSFHYGAGSHYNYYFPAVAPESVGIKNDYLSSKIDSIANDAITQHATPGCVVLVAKNGKIAFEKSYGYTNYDSIQPVNVNMIYDLASVTKVSATTVSVMKLYEEGKLNLNKTLGDYLPWVRGSNKEKLVLKNILLHQAGLVSYIPFYKETLEGDGYKPGIFAVAQDSIYNVRVAENLYMRSSYRDTMFKKILDSKLGAPNKYVYSDNDFIFLGKVVEAITGQPLEDYVRETFYLPLHMMTTSFHPREHFPINTIVPTENDTLFRHQQLRGDVHDPGAAMFGGVAGHAGLFSNAYDLAQLYQLLLNGGELNGVRLLKKKTINYFTAYHSKISRRGLGFDKPEKDNATRKDPYPTLSASPQTFGHTGYTGICVWADPKYKLLYIFMSNRVTPDDQPKLLRMNVRTNIQEAIYEAMGKAKKSKAKK